MEAGSGAALLVAAAIWGVAFVAQRAGMDHVGPFLFNGIRFLLGTLVLIPLWIVRRTAPLRRPTETASRGTLIVGCVVAGAVLFVASSLQQVGLVYTTAGKAGFITGLYVVFVPLVGLVRGQRIRPAIGVAAALAAGGLYLLSLSGGGGVAAGDAVVLCGAFVWAIHVHLIAWLAERVRPLAIAVIQCAVCGTLSLATAFAVEAFSVEAVLAAAPAIAYAGFLSVGVAYTLQIVGQRHIDPSRAGILLSLEAVFAVVGGWAILGETVSLRMSFGCGLMLLAMILSNGLRPRVGVGAPND